MARVPSRLLLTALCCAVVLVTSCSPTTSAADAGGKQPRAHPTTLPEEGACRVLTPADVARPSNSTRTVPCTEFHTAQTYAVARLPARFDDVARDDPDVRSFATRACEEGFAELLGADESEAMRTILGWVWFRPSPQAWNDGARWYRCDVVGGGAAAEEYVGLPRDAEGLLRGSPPDRWMVCARGKRLRGAPRVRCSEPHTWRAVTTITLGEPSDDYPGDHVVQVRTRKYCAESVRAWLGYPADFDFGYTWFGKAHWQAGNRRSICWVREDTA